MKFVVVFSIHFSLILFHLALLLFAFSLRPALSSTPLSLQVTTMASVSRSASERSDESDNEDSRNRTQARIHVDPSQAIPTSTKARAKRRIAALEEELETLRHERGSKQR